MLQAGKVAQTVPREEARARGPGTSPGRRCNGGSAGPLPSPAYLALPSWIELLAPPGAKGARSSRGKLGTRAVAAGSGRARAGFRASKAMGWGGDSGVSGTGSHRACKAGREQRRLEPSPAPFDLQQQKGQDGNAAACKRHEIRLISNYGEVSPCYLAGTFWPPWAMGLRQRAGVTKHLLRAW